MDVLSGGVIYKIVEAADIQASDAVYEALSRFCIFQSYLRTNPFVNKPEARFRFDPGW